MYIPHVPDKRKIDKFRLLGDLTQGSGHGQLVLISHMFLPGKITQVLRL